MSSSQCHISRVLGDLYECLRRHPHLSNAEKHRILFSYVEDKDKGIQSGYLKLCILEGNEELLELALKAGVDPNTRCVLGSATPMLPLSEVVANERSVRMLDMLIEKGADVNACNDPYYTVLSQAIWHESSIFIALLRHGGKLPDDYHHRCRRRTTAYQWRLDMIDRVDAMIVLVWMEILPVDLLRVFITYI